MTYNEMKEAGMSAAQINLMMREPRMLEGREDLGPVVRIYGSHQHASARALVRRGLVRMFAVGGIHDGYYFRHLEPEAATIIVRDGAYYRTGIRVADDKVRIGVRVRRVIYQPQINQWSIA